MWKKSLIAIFATALVLPSCTLHIIRFGSSDATLTSTVYTVSTGETKSGTIVGVLDRTSKASFLAALSKGNRSQTWDETGLHDPVLTNDTLIVTSQDQTMVVTYTVTVTLYNLRDTGPAGGLIFYINSNYETDGWKYLEAAPSDQSPDPGTGWGCMGTLLSGADGMDIGTGKQNTADILAGCSESGIAAELTVGDLYSNGHRDWFLPSAEELDRMNWNLRSGLDENSVVFTPVGNFTDDLYWSSTQYDDNWAWYDPFNIPYNYEGYDRTDKSDTKYVRAIRSF